MKKKKRQQRAQSWFANARYRQKEREERTRRLAERAEKRWNMTQRQLAQLGVVLLQTEVLIKERPRTVYQVTYQGKTLTFRARSSVQKWLHRTLHPIQEEEISWAERHVWWMIENNCDDVGNPWPE